MGDKTIDDKEEFRQAIFYAAEKIGYQALADEFFVSIGTIRRWINGKSIPAKLVRNKLKERAVVLLQKANEETEKKEFSSFISEALKKVSAEEIVRVCGDEVATTTVARWANGSASPHPRIRKLFTQLIQELLQNKRAE